MGISGLAARVRAKIAEISGEERPPRMTPARQIMDQINTLTDHVTRDRSAGMTLRRHGLAVSEDGDLHGDRRREVPKRGSPPAGGHGRGNRG